MRSTAMAVDSSVNEILAIIGRDVFEYEVSKFLQPYERFLLSATCTFLSAIFSLNNFNFELHSHSDLSILNQPIIDKYFQKKKSYRHTSNCINLSHSIYSSLTRHERLCIKYILIFQQKLPEYFPTNSFQNFIDRQLKISFSSNDAKHADSIMNFLYDTVVHPTSNIHELIQSVHLDNVGLHSVNHLKGFSNQILCRLCNIRYLYLADNPRINDDGIRELFTCIAAHCHNLEILDLSNTGITNATCDIIFDFCLSVYRVNNGKYGDICSNANVWNAQKTNDDNEEIIYMSADDETDGDEESFNLSTDDEFDSSSVLFVCLFAVCFLSRKRMHSHWDKSDKWL